MTPLSIKNIKKSRKNLKSGKFLIGGLMQLSNLNLAEIMSDSNYNWIALENYSKIIRIRALKKLVQI